MTRTIRLTRLHALNWDGYKDTLPIGGNALLAGVTGSGKSALMDLIQLVLVGDQRLVRFNQSATGDRGAHQEFADRHIDRNGAPPIPEAVSGQICDSACGTVRPGSLSSSPSEKYGGL